MDVKDIHEIVNEMQWDERLEEVNMQEWEYIREHLINKFVPKKKGEFEMIVTHKDGRKPEKLVFTSKKLLNNALASVRAGGVSWREV